MPRPLALRLLPPRLAGSLWNRWYHRRLTPAPALYQAAPLRFAPYVRMDLVPGDFVSDAIAYTGLYELPLTRRLLALAHRGGLMVDVGANLGYFSLLWTAGRPANHCLALEPAPLNLTLLRRNAAANRCAGRLEILDCAAGAAAGQAAFDPGPTGQHGWGHIVAGGGEHAFTVNLVRLDDVVPAGATVSLLKIDTEGADALVLEGARELLRSSRVAEIWFEQHASGAAALGLPADASVQLLRSLGYTCTPRSSTGADTVDWSAVRAA